LNFDVLINFTKQPKKNSSSKKYVFILNEDPDLNRNLLVKAEKLARLNKDNKYFLMLGSEENKKFIKERFGVEFNTYPQMIKLEDDYVNANDYKEDDKNLKDSIDATKRKELVITIPINYLLSYQIDLETLNEKILNKI